MTPETSAYSVTQLNREIRNLLELSYRTIWVTGEISNLAKPASGHLYFSLKEDRSVIRCAFFKNHQKLSQTLPKQGMQVLVRGQVSFYEPRGDLQFIVDFLEDAGEGALRREFELLKKQLQSEGLFAVTRKLNLPITPKTIGIITSDSGAALQDILITLGRRYPLASVIIYPTVVQGDRAPDSISTALDTARKRNETDVIILARGGGSLEDLQGFNSEQVARAIFRCTIPIATGIGHETDFTIADFVADCRAATPTAAAEMITPDIQTLKQNVQSSTQDLIRQTNRTVRDFQQILDLLQPRLIRPKHRLDNLISRYQYLDNHIIHLASVNLLNIRSELRDLLNKLNHHSPATRVNLSKQNLVNCKRLLLLNLRTTINERKNKLKIMRDKMLILDPNNTLKRGYALVQSSSGKIITEATHTNIGQQLSITLARGKMSATIDKILK